MAEFVGGNRLLENAICNMLLECFVAIEAISWSAIEKLGGADCKPGAPHPPHEPLHEIAGHLMEARGMCEELASIMGLLLCSTEQMPLHKKNAEYIEELEAGLQRLAKRGGLRAACGEIKGGHG